MNGLEDRMHVSRFALAVCTAAIKVAIALTVSTIAQAQEPIASDGPWSGTVECNTEPGAATRSIVEKQTWSLTGAVVGVQGAMRIHNASWSTASQGSSQRANGLQSIQTDWQGTVAPQPTRWGIFIRASDGKLIFRQWEAPKQIVNAFAGTRRASRTGAAAELTAIKGNAVEWNFGWIVGDPSAMEISGSQPATYDPQTGLGNAGDKPPAVNCTYRFVRGATEAATQTVATAVDIRPAAPATRANSNLPAAGANRGRLSEVLPQAPNTADLVSQITAVDANGVTATSLTPGVPSRWRAVFVTDGPDSVDGATIAVPPVPGLTKTSVACFGHDAICPPGLSIASLESGLAVPSWPLGGYVSIEILTDVWAVAGSRAAMTGIVTLPAGATDPRIEDNSATLSLPVAGGSSPQSSTGGNDLSTYVRASNAQGQAAVSLTAGSRSRWVVYFENNGPGAADGALLTVPRAAGLSMTGVSCFAGQQPCVPDPTVAQIENGFALPAWPTGTNIVMYIDATVTAGAGDTVAMTSSVKAPAGASDSNPANNGFSRPMQVLSSASTGGTSSADIVVLLDSVDLAGQPVGSLPTSSRSTWVVQINNNGPADITGAVVTVAPGGGLMKSAVSCTPARSDAQCPANPTTAQIESGLSIPWLRQGAYLRFTILADVTPAPGGSVTMTADVTAPAALVELSPANNRATRSVPVTAPSSGVPRSPADLRTVLRASDATGTVTTQLAAGNNATWVLRFFNDGPGAADGAIITAPRGPGVSKTSVGCLAVTPYCPPTITIAQLEGGFAIPTWPPGVEVAFIVKTDLTASVGSTVALGATVSPPANVADADLTNNSVSYSATIN